ncbi:MAG: PqqD family protein [Rhizomicrobium sp.]
MASTLVYARSRDVIAAEIQGEVLLFDTVTWAYLEFDPVGTAIWALLDVPRSLPSLVEALQKAFVVDALQCGADTQSFLDDMIAQGVITVTDAP